MKDFNREVKKEFKDNAAIKLLEFIKEFSCKLSIIKVLNDKRYFVCVAFNDETNTYRFAAVSGKGKKESPVYYYDISKEALNNNDLDRVINALTHAISYKPIKYSFEITSVEQLKGFIEEVKSDNIPTDTYVYSIFNLLMLEIIDYFSGEPYLNGHTSDMQLGQDWDYTSKNNKIISIIKDKDGNFKNIDDSTIFKFHTVSEREKYIEENYDTLINIIK